MYFAFRRNKLVSYKEGVKHCYNECSRPFVLNSVTIQVIQRCLGIGRCFRYVNQRLPSSIILTNKSILY